MATAGERRQVFVCRPVPNRSNRKPVGVFQAETSRSLSSGSEVVTPAGTEPEAGDGGLSVLKEKRRCGDQDEQTVTERPE